MKLNKFLLFGNDNQNRYFYDIGRDCRFRHSRRSTIPEPSLSTRAVLRFFPNSNATIGRLNSVKIDSRGEIDTGPSSRFLALSRMHGGIGPDREKEGDYDGYDENDESGLDDSSDALTAESPRSCFMRSNKTNTNLPPFYDTVGMR